MDLTVSFPFTNVINRMVCARDEQCIREAVTQTASELSNVAMLLCFARVVACIHAPELGFDERTRTLNIKT